MEIALRSGRDLIYRSPNKNHKVQADLVLQKVDEKKVVSKNAKNLAKSKYSKEKAVEQTPERPPLSFP